MLHGRDGQSPVPCEGRGGEGGEGAEASSHAVYELVYIYNV